MAYSYQIIITETDGYQTVLNPNSLYTTFKLDETLDSGLMELKLLTREAPFKRFSRINIQVKVGTTVYRENDWIVYTPNREIAVRGANKKYNHTLGLIEPTKWLEKTITGTKTFTQSLSGTPKTLKTIVQEIIDISPIVQYDDLDTTRLVTLDTTFASILDNYEAPQMYFDKKNMWEVLIGAFSFVNAFPRVYYDGSGNRVLTGDFINTRHLNFTVAQQFDELDIIDYSDSANGAEYANKVEIFHENTIPNNKRDTPIVFAQSKEEYVSYRSNEVILSDSNLNLTLSDPIERINDFKALYYYLDNVWELDLNEYIFEKSVYDTLDYAKFGDQSVKGTRSTAVYYEYKSNIINGFSETFGLLDFKMAIRNIVKDAMLEQFSVDINSVDYQYVIFHIGYIPFIKTMRSEQYREDNEDFVDSTIIINQQERINELFNLTKRTYGQIQRIGVDSVTFSKMHKDIRAYNETTSPNGIYSVGDYTDDGYFITKVEIAYYRTFAIGRYEMSKNWNRVSQFAKISKEFRAYEISLTNTNKTLKRDILFPLFKFVVSSSYDSEHKDNVFSQNFIKTFLDSTFDKPITNMVVRPAWESNGNIVSFATATYMPLKLLAEKNTIKYKLDFEDTKIAGKRKGDSDEQGFFITKLFQVPYTLGDGTMEYITMDLYDNYWVTQNINSLDISERIFAFQALTNISDRFPLINTNENVVVTSSVSPIFTTATFVATEQYLFDNDEYYLANYTTQSLFYAEDTKKVYQLFTGISPVTNSHFYPYGIGFAIKNDSQYKMPLYKIHKDSAEILGIEISLPIIPDNQEINKFVIGDYLSKENALITDRETGIVLYFWYKSTPFLKTETDKIIGGFNTMITVASNVSGNYIDIPSVVYSAYDYFAIGDSDGNMFLGVNQVDYAGTKTNVTRIYFNLIGNATSYGDFDLINNIIDAEFQLDLNMNVDYISYNNYLAELLLPALNLDIDYVSVDNTFKQIEFKLNKPTMTIAARLAVNDWTGSNESYWNQQDALGNAYTNSSGVLPLASDYAVGDALRLTDGSLPITYTYWKIILV